MNSYVVLIRGINVGGKNKVPMADLRGHLESAGFEDVSTYIASGNVLLKSSKKANDVKSAIEALLPAKFKLDSELIKVLVLTRKQLEAVIKNKPKGFGDESDKYYSDAIFLIDIDVKDAIEVFDPREGVDRIWTGDGVIYSERLGAERTKSKLSKIIGTIAYKSMTIRSWSTTTKLLDLMSK